MRIWDVNKMLGVALFSFTSWFYCQAYHCFGELLAKVHNFCIDAKEVLENLHPMDKHTLLTQLTGYIPLESCINCNVPLLVQLLDVRHHTDDVSRQYWCRMEGSTSCMPQEKLHEKVCQQHLKHPSTYSTVRN